MALSVFYSLTINAQLKEHIDGAVTTIAFGSCGKQDKDQPVLRQAVEHNADLFLFLGDNIYGDTKKMKVLRSKYAKLGAKPEFQQLWDSMEVVATWDDHDFGQNDGGRHYPKKEESKEVFLDFWKVPETDVRHTRSGIYTSYFYEDEGFTVQVIVLDTRTFRDNLRKYRGEPVDKAAFHYGLDYWPHESDKYTLLGKDQWKWLEEQLTIPADVRIVASSTQFGITWNSYEAWANFPSEQKRFLELIKKTQANGVLFVSGDVHYAEISKLEHEGLYPIYDITSSGITSKWGFATPNDNRIDGPVMDNHIGLITIDRTDNDPQLKVSIVDVDGNARIERTILLSELQIK